MKGRKPGLINDLEHKEKIKIQPGQNEEIRIQKNDKFKNLWDNFKCSNNHRIRVSEEEQKEQGIENCLKK